MDVITGIRCALICLLLVVAGCSSLQVSSDYDGAVDFASLRTYDWLPAPDVKTGDPPIQYDSLLAQRLKAAVDTQLAARGLRRQTENPDMLVTYHVAVDQTVSVTYLNELYGYGPGRGTGYRRNMRYYDYPSREAFVTEYKQGTLIIDMVGASDKKLIWRGVASDEVYPDSTAEAKEKRVHEAVEAIFSQFPPPNGGK